MTARFNRKKQFIYQQGASAGGRWRLVLELFAAQKANLVLVARGQQGWT